MPQPETLGHDCAAEPKLTAEEWAAVAALTADQQPTAGPDDA